jgi:hypothetical protein
MERDLERLPPDLQTAILEAGRILEAGIGTNSEFTFATFRTGSEVVTAYYVVEEDTDGIKRFAFEIMID